MNPNNQPTVNQVVKALSRESVGVGALLVGGLKNYPAQPRNQWEEDLETDIMNHGLSDQ